MKKSWKKLGVTAIGLLAVATLAACGGTKEKTKTDGGDKKADAKTDKLVIYSPNSEGLINATIPAFEEKYGIKVELIQAGTGELFKKLESEASSPVADVIFGGLILSMMPMQIYLKNIPHQKMISSSKIIKIKMVTQHRTHWTVVLSLSIQI